MYVSVQCGAHGIIGPLGDGWLHIRVDSNVFRQRVYVSHFGKEVEAPGGPAAHMFHVCAVQVATPVVCV